MFRPHCGCVQESAGELRMRNTWECEACSFLTSVCPALGVLLLPDCGTRGRLWIRNVHPLCKLLVLLLSVRGGFASAWEAQSQNLLMGERLGVCR